MRLATVAFRETGEHPLPKNLAVPVPSPNHRPQIRYRFTVHSEKDVDTLHRHGLPIHLLTSRKVSELGYPITFPSQAVIARSFQPLVESSLSVLPFVSSEAAISPKDEDAVVAMLRLDMLGARAMWDRNCERLDALYLLRRIFEEKVERRAAFVRFSDVLAGIPKSADALDPVRLDSKLRKHPSLRSRP